MTKAAIATTPHQLLGRFGCSTLAAPRSLGNLDRYFWELESRRSECACGSPGRTFGCRDPTDPIAPTDRELKEKGGFFELELHSNLNFITTPVGSFLSSAVKITVRLPNENALRYLTIV